MVEVVEVNGCRSFDDFVKAGKELKRKYPAWREFRIVKINTNAYWEAYGGLRKAGFMFDAIVTPDGDIDLEHARKAKNVIIVDIDGTLIDSEYVVGEGFKLKGVKRDVVEVVNSLYDEGNLIVIHTARSSVLREETKELLKSIGVKYDVLVHDKLFGDLIIDDADLKVIHPDSIVRIFKKALSK